MSAAKADTQLPLAEIMRQAKRNPWAVAVLVLPLKRRGIAPESILGAGMALGIIALALIIGGALGNVVDRVRIGAVVDYLDLHWRDMHWPAFNLADIFIVGSAALLVLAAFRPGANGQQTGQGSTG
jgi:signal peptidase II